MTEPNLEPTPSSPPGEREYQDPHYHDEDLEIQADDIPRRHGSASLQRRANRRPPPRSRYMEE